MIKEVVLEAQKRLAACLAWEGDARILWLQDVKFANGDSDNGYQWPMDIRQDRDLLDKPCLTVNKTRQHNLQIINDAKKNKPGITYRPTGGGASYESAQAWNSLARNMEYQSNASAIYDLATRFQVEGGIGYWRFKTDWESEDSMNQEIYLVPVVNPLAVFLDPDAQEADKSDGRFGLVFEDIPKEDFDKRWPKFKNLGNTVLGGSADWISKDHVRICEYYRKVETKDHLAIVEGESIFKSQVAGNVWDALDLDSIPNREVMKEQVEYYFIIGDEVAEKRDWPGKYIPIVALIGEETIIEGRLDRKGHTRALKDAQRMYNYWSSSAVEFGALQTKTPWLAAAEALEGYETYWNDANKINTSVLTYNARDETGQILPPPQRIEPPVAAPVALSGMEIAAREMEMVSGQYSAQMGAPGNERTGKAIQERQRQGATSSYHFIDQLAISIRFTGKIFMDLARKIYDTEKVMNVFAADGSNFELKLDPNLQEVYQQELDKNQEVAKRILNPLLGKYEVQADIGPAYATKREEAFNAFTLILTQAPQLAQIIGDLLLKAGDFPMADEAAIRLKRMVPPQALGKGPSESEQMLQAQIQNLTTNLTAMMEELAITRLKLKGKEQGKEVDVYKAITDRIKVLGDHVLSGHELAMLGDQVVAEASDTSLEPVRASAESAIEGKFGVPTDEKPEQMELPLQTPPMPGARKSKDGKWYVPDPGRPGKYSLIHEGL